MIEEAYCSYELAKMLKEKGVTISDVEKYGVYYDQGCKFLYIGKEDGCLMNETCVNTYTHSVIMRWLREVHAIHIQALCPIVDIDTDALGVKYNVVISNLKNDCIAFDTELDDNKYGSYEKACEDAIKYCLTYLIE